MILKTALMSIGLIKKKTLPELGKITL